MCEGCVVGGCEGCVGVGVWSVCGWMWKLTDIQIRTYYRRQN